MKRVTNILFTLIFVCAIILAPICTVLGPRSYTSFYEQRALASKPEITWAGLLDGQVFTDAEVSFSDHFMVRDKFVKLNTWLDLVLMRPVVNDVIVSSDVLLPYHGFMNWDTAYLAELAEKSGSDYRTLNNEIKAYGGYFCYLGLPLQSAYYADQYPDYMDDRQWSIGEIRAEFSNAMQENDVPFIDMHTVFDSMGGVDDFYYETDHHYSFRGAFTAYTELMNRINADTGYNVEVLSESDLNIITVPNEFLGSSNRKLYGLWSTEDKLEIATPKETVTFTRSDNGVPVQASLFPVPENVEDIVTYSVNMGGDIAETVIDTNRPELPSILVFGDSFTNPLETLVWFSFNKMYSLDLRYYTEETLTEYISKYKPDVVICVRDETVYLSPAGNGAIADS